LNGPVIFLREGEREGGRESCIRKLGGREEEEEEEEGEEEEEEEEGLLTNNE
jgi:hypothetical protein